MVKIRAVENENIHNMKIDSRVMNWEHIFGEKIGFGKLADDETCDY